MGANVQKADRRKIVFKTGEFVSHQNKIYQLTNLINFEEAIGVDIKTGRSERLLIISLEIAKLDDNLERNNGHIHRDLADVSDDNWKEIERRFSLIQPILKNASRSEIELHATQHGTHFTTLYRWVRHYHATGSLLGLLPKKKGINKGTIKTESQVENIISKIVDEYYLSKQRPTIKATLDAIKIACKHQNVEAPSDSTIRRRISTISEYQRLKRRNEKNKAKKYEPAPGSFEATYPLQVVQIDHTPVDLILVDDEYRLPIGRPYITFAICIYSRMIVGYWLSLDAPSTTSVAMCIGNSINPKDELLLLKRVESTWPVWGFMETIHVDNAGEFRSDTLKRSCLIHDINLDFRPINQPQYGSHIERLIGTVMKKVHNLPGTTFSNIEERAEYDSDGNAVFTFDELDKYILTYITKYYHKNRHSSLGVSPEDKWHQGIFGNLHSEGIGYPPKPNNPDTIYKDFLPIIERTIQSNGVNIDGLNYFDNVLRPFLHAMNEETNKKKKFVFRRDPRDISYIWFYEANNQTYFKIPLANTTIPPMSIWEFREAKKRIQEYGYTFSEHVLLDTLQELNEMAEEAAKKTRKIRRNQQKKQINKTNLQKITPQSQHIQTPDDDELWNDDIPVFN